MTTGTTVNRSSSSVGIGFVRVALSIIVFRFVFVSSTIRHSHATSATGSPSATVTSPTTPSTGLLGSTNRSSHYVREDQAGDTGNSDISINNTKSSNHNVKERSSHDTGTKPSHSQLDHPQQLKDQTQQDYGLLLLSRTLFHPHDLETSPIISSSMDGSPSFAPTSIPSTTPTFHTKNNPVEPTSIQVSNVHDESENVIDSDTDVDLAMDSNDELELPANSQEMESSQDSSNNQRIRFFNRIARVSTILLRREKDARLLKDGHNVSDFTMEGEEDNDNDDDEDDIVDDEVTFQSDLTRPGRYIHIVTTASLPWFTGTAVNPLLRAAYLHERLEQINRNANMSHPFPTTTTTNTIFDKNNESKPLDEDEDDDNDDKNAYDLNQTKTSWVTLVIPWLELPEDQKKVYNGQVFDTPKDQERYVREWLRDQADMPDAADNLNLVFYTARYHEGLGSVFAMGDIIQQLPQDELDVCVLEEPEHVNWFRAPGQGWTKRYNYVIGIVHTNYDQYATQHYSGLWTAPAIRLMSAAMVRAYCHKVIKLSDVVQVFAPEKEVTVNVHGVRKEFIASPLEIINTSSNTSGSVPETDNQGGEGKTRSSVYFIGKLLWAKGLDMLLELEDYYKQVTGEYFPIDIYGSGPDMEEIERAYLGRWAVSEHPKSKIRKTSKNLFSKFFSFINRRRWKRKRHRSKKNRSTRGASSQITNSTDDSVATTPEELYRDILDILEALPEKAKESLEWFPNQARETIGQWTEDMEFTKKSMQRLPAKARRAVNKLLDDLSRTPLPRSLHELRLQPVPATFPGRIDHAVLKGDSHKIFVNPSVSEVLCTTTAEALAMGKFVIIPVHPENYFFLKNPNCLAYRTPYEFVANLQWALTHDPVVLTEEQSRIFTWEAATDRLIDAAAITHREARDRESLGRSRMDERIAWFHNEIGKGVKGDIIRKALGGGPVSDQVRYVSRSQQFDGDNEDDDGVDLSDGDETEGLSKKFRDSAFVQALRTAFENGATSYS